MKYLNFELTTPGFILLLFLSAFCSCKDGDIKKESTIQLKSATDIKAFPGLHRVKLSWTVKGSNIKKAVAYCDNGDSIIVAYDNSAEMTALFTGLEGGNYSFSVYLYDKNGNKSERAQVVARIYGDRYIQSLSSRVVKDAIYEDGKVIVAWDSPVTEGLGTEISYIDNTGDTQTVFAIRETDSTVLQQYKAGTYFKLRTLYKPISSALDSFYAVYTSSESFSAFSNPILVDRGADPWVIYKDGMYYFTYTQGGGITLYATKKMSQLSAAEPVEVWRPQSGTAHSKNLWAPELHFIDNKWYVYFAADDGQNMNHRMYVIENDSPDPLQGSWEFKGELQEPSDQWAIDGTILEYNEQLYMIWSGSTNGTAPQELYIAKMSNPYTLEGSRIKISTPLYDWEKHGAAINEGPEILKNNKGRVFLIYSGSGYWKDEYCLGMLSLKDGGDPLNPEDWEKHSEPVFEQAEGAYGTGHCSFFTSRDGTENWISYHARSNPGGSGARTARIQKFTWNTDGTPNFGTPVPINTLIRTPSGEF